MKEKYILKYRYLKYKFWGIDDEWKIKEYKALDKNDLINEINKCIREYKDFYIIDLKEVKEKEIKIISWLIF